MKVLTAAILAAILTAVVCFADTEPPEQMQTVQVAVCNVTANSVTVVLRGERVDVQRDAILRSLSDSERCAIDRYMVVHGGDGECQNQRALRNAIEFLTRINQSHFPLSRSPREYLADYQVFTQMLGKIDWFVRLPDRRVTVELPPVHPTERIVYKPVEVPAVNVTVEKPPDIVVTIPNPQLAVSVTVQLPPPAAPIGFVPVQSCGQVNATRSQSVEHRLAGLGIGWTPVTRINIRNNVTAYGGAGGAGGNAYQWQTQGQWQGQHQTGPVVIVKPPPVNPVCPPLPGGPPQPPVIPPAGPTCPPLVPGSPGTVTTPDGVTHPVEPPPAAAGG